MDDIHCTIKYGNGGDACRVRFALSFLEMNTIITNTAITDRYGRNGECSIGMSKVGKEGS